MKSGIIKIIPPPEWKEKQPLLDDMIKHVRVREPIKQDIMGSNGTYRQVNILHGRSYNVPQWRQLCEQSEHQPPARRGERRANADKPKPRRQPAPKPAESSTPKKRGKAKSKKGRGRPGKKDDDDRPMTPVSPKPESSEDKEDVVDSVEKDPGEDVDTDEPPAAPGRMGAARPAKSKTQSVSARRKYSRREGSAMIDEAAFKNFDYKMDISDYTPERCEELERAYWKTLTYAAPLYGADMMGTLFDDRTESWNLNKLPNLLDVLGTKIPGVNTAYLYFGMWKATFAWHLEDVDLYSINYVHFGAPKQWYSISQADARRFEAAMKNIWPADAKACSQFLRHKGFLISPQHLLSHYGIKVNKVVSYPGEFVVTFPYGYHSGYNLGYNCAEAVNFALKPWLEMGKIAKRCECAQAQDSVWINVYEIERKMRGEETEYEETDEEEDEEDEDQEGVFGLPSPPSSHGVKINVASKKRKRATGDKGGKTKVKKIKLRLKTKTEPPCCLCPNDISTMELLPTDDDRKAHRICALYLPETYIDSVDGKEIVCNVSGIHKDRTDLKCLFCRSKRGACFQCSQKKCARAYHATCAAAAGVFVEEEEVPVFGEDQTEYKEQAFEFSCRFHRSKRDKKLDGVALEDDERIRKSAAALKKGDIGQFQYFKGEIFAGVVVENRADEQTLLVDVLPNGYVDRCHPPTLFLTSYSDRLEVEWKWLLLPDPSDHHLPKASANAIPMPASQKAKEKLNAKRSGDEKPRKDDPFTDGCTWAEFNIHEVDRNKDQVKVDLAKDNQIWYYLGKTSTDAKAQYTENPSNPRHNTKSNYLDTIPKPAKPTPTSAAKRKSYPPQGTHVYSYPQYNRTTTQAGRVDKPYVYKPKQPPNANSNMPMFSTQRFTPTSPAPQAPPRHHDYYHPQNTHGSGYQGNQVFTAQCFEVKTPQHHAGYPGSTPSPYQGTQPAQGNWNANMHSQQPQSRSQGYSSQSPPPRAPAAPAPAQTRQPSKFMWQVHQSIYQKYPFFQVHHNRYVPPACLHPHLLTSDRDSSKYRTPYSPWGGFTNGYEGDLRAHLIANPQELMRRSSMTSGSPPNVTIQPARPPSAQQSVYNKGAIMSVSPSTPQPPLSSASVPQQQPSISPPVPTGPPPHAAQRPDQTPRAQPTPQSRPPSQTASKPKPAMAPKTYKIPPKESPVPLPANFLAAMKSSSGASPSAPKPPVTQATAQPAVSGAQLAQPKVSTPQPSEVAKTSKSPSSAGSPARNGSAKISTTPVPVPKFPVMTPHQAAARAQKASPPMPNTQQGQQASPGLVSAAPSGVQPIPVPAPSVPTAGAMVTDALAAARTQEFPDVPGSESMEFMEKMMANLRRVVQGGSGT